MKAGTLLFIVKDVIGLLQSSGVLTAAGDFDDTKLDTIQEDTAFAAGIEAILKAHGVDVPEKVDTIIRILPLVASFVR